MVILQGFFDCSVAEQNADIPAMPCSSIASSTINQPLFHIKCVKPARHNGSTGGNRPA
jgi:hypothetical protein